MLRVGLQTLVRLVYPPRCLVCGGLVETDLGLCGTCWRETPFISGLRCDLCGVPLPGESDDAEHCDDCLATPRPWAQGRAALVYRDTGRRLVLMLKHGDRHDIAEAAGLWMARGARSMMQDGMIAVPVPLHLRRHLSRRFNQSALLARSLADALGLDWSSEALARVRHTQSLEGRGRAERFETLREAIAPGREAAALHGRPVLLVDDVMTSGATLAVASEACLAAGASSVCVMVLARAAKDA